MLHSQFLPPIGDSEELYPVDDRAYYLSVYGAEAVAQRSFFNVGAGRFRHPCWQTVDFVHEQYDLLQGSTAPDIVYDLTRLEPLPMPAASAWALYTSHTIEHVRDDAVANLFSEAWRVLKPGGVFRVLTPDFDAAYRAYMSDDLRHFRTFTTAAATPADQVRFRGARKYYKHSLDVTQAFLIHFARQVAQRTTIDGETLADYVRRRFTEDTLPVAADHFTALCDDAVHRRNPAGHINWFNEHKIRGLLEAAGFDARWVYRSSYGQSSAAVMRNLRYFDNSRPCFSIYMEAVRT